MLCVIDLCEPMCDRILSLYVAEHRWSSTIYSKNIMCDKILNFRVLIENLCVLEYWICTWQSIVEVIQYVQRTYIERISCVIKYWILDFDRKLMCVRILNLYLAEHGWSYATARIDAKAIKPQLPFQLLNWYMDVNILSEEIFLFKVLKKSKVTAEATISGISDTLTWISCQKKYFFRKCSWTSKRCPGALVQGHCKWLQIKSTAISVFVREILFSWMQEICIVNH